MAETSKTEPTIEDLQNQILALQAEREQLKKDSESMKEQVTTLKDSLTQSRDLNSKLLHKLPNSFEGSIEPEQESHEETREEYILQLKKDVKDGKFNGEANLAVFKVDVKTGKLLMLKTKNLKLIDFRINEKGRLEELLKWITQ